MRILRTFLFAKNARKALRLDGRMASERNVRLRDCEAAWKCVKAPGDWGADFTKTATAGSVSVDAAADGRAIGSPSLARCVFFVLSHRRLLAEYPTRVRGAAVVS